MKHNWLRLLAAVSLLILIVFAGLLIFAMVTYFNDRNAGPVNTSIAVPTPSAPREVKDITTNGLGELIITYTDRTVQNAGKVVGQNGQDGASQVPSQAQLSAALIEYCANGRCDAKLPTQEQIFSAITAYCSGGVCKGSDATPVTTEQILAAVTAYCSSGRCTGTPGATGQTGARGESTVMACIIRSVSGGTAKYVAWRYASEANTAYRDLYKLPVWAECSDPVDLTAK
jgi:hypothetical protein